jgi:hypothetical protein
MVIFYREKNGAILERRREKVEKEMIPLPNENRHCIKYARNRGIWVPAIPTELNYKTFFSQNFF